MTIWELKALAEQKIKDKELIDQQRNAWQNALNGAIDAIKLYDDIFYGRADCPKECRRFKNDFCNNGHCAVECERMVQKNKKETEQISLF